MTSPPGLPSSAPPGLGRLFPGPAAGLLSEPANPLVVARILEEGEEADLRWLTQTLDETELRRWLETRGGRQLSPRSRRFWQLVLGAAPSPAAELEEALWNL
ncbi:MAG: hypothetical protein SX243_02990 [Acidobacteriota bacterium]|nr:hypothetical protein [Acidobacteriota bacterium]